MPTTSQWKILHALLKAGRLKRNDSTLDTSVEKTEQDKENGEHQIVLSKDNPQRRNSFHFSKNGRGVLTIICRPKSVPVSFATKKENNGTINETNQRSPHEQTTYGVNLNGKSQNDDFQDNRMVPNIQEETNVHFEANPKCDNWDTRSQCDNVRYETSSTTCYNQSNQDVTNYDEDENLTSLAWDGLSSFPELLDPNGMKTKDRKHNPSQPASSASVLKRWHALNSNTIQSNVSKSVTFCRPFSGNTFKHNESDEGDIDEIIDDEDNMEINFDNIDKILPKFNNPLGGYANNKISNFHGGSSSQSSTSSNVRSLRPLKSAPSFRKVSKSLAVFNNNNNTRQRSKSSLGSHTESTRSSIDHGISNDTNNPLINSSMCSGGFKLRHTTFAYKEFPGIRIRDRPRSSPNTQQKLTDVAKPKVTTGAESESFEPYVIHNGRLVRRGSMSNGMFAASSNSNAPGLVRKGSAKFSILGKDEATTLSRICDAFIIRGGSGTSRRGDQPGDYQRSTAVNGLQRPLSGPWPTKAVSRWSMATQSIITRSVSSASLAATSSPSATGSGFHESTVTVADPEEIELTEEVQEDLHKLGFRKQKGKRKKSEKSKKAQPKKSEVREESLKGGIDLKQDPMLVKVQKKNRNVGTFACEPQPQPFAISFEVKGSAPSHAEVLAEMKKLQKNHPEVLITKMQFDYRALVNNSPDMENRWIVTTNSVASRNRIAGSHIRLHGQEAHLRRYDDVITTEYQQYKRMMDFVKMMNSRLGMK